jgi:hypothetical protein
LKASGITTSRKKGSSLKLLKNDYPKPQRDLKMIHDDPDDLKIWTPQSPKILPWPKRYFEQIQEMTDRELKLRATHLHEEKQRRLKILLEMPSKKRKKKKKTNAQDP